MILPSLGSFLRLVLLFESVEHMLWHVPVPLDSPDGGERPVALFQRLTVVHGCFLPGSKLLEKIQRHVNKSKKVQGLIFWESTGKTLITKR